MLSFGAPYTAPRGSSFNFTFSPPISAPFWDDVDITRGGTIYYRQDTNSTIMDLVQKAIALEYPEAASFQPSLVFVATWDRVEEYGFDVRSLVNTFQVVVASDGTWTFVRFSYGDIQWGGIGTLIGVSAGDGVNFITHSASRTSAVLMLDNTTATYRIDGMLSCGIIVSSELIAILFLREYNYYVTYDYYSSTDRMLYRRRNSPLFE